MKASPYAPAENLVNLLLDAICVVDKQGRFVFVSAACERIFGYRADEMIGRAMIEMVFPEDRGKTLQAASEIMAGINKPDFENRYVRKDGQVVHILWSARWSEDDQVRIAVAHDITERKRSESLQAALYAISEAAHAAKDLRGLFKQAHLIIGELLPALNFFVALRDAPGSALNISYPCASQLAVQQPIAADLAAEVVHSGKTLLLSTGSRSPLPAHLCQLDLQNSHWLGVPLKSHNGTIGALIVQSDAQDQGYTERDQELLQFVSTQLATAAERQQMISHLQFMAQYDTLTHLPNRELLHDRLHTALARARREQMPLALLFLDLDKFKQVNDSLGHASGDLLLQQVAQRIQHCLREVDTVARFAGDEFVVLLEDFHSAEHANQVAEKIRLALNAPFDLQGHSRAVFPSIGIALYPLHAQDAQQLLNYADSAMYQAKNKGGNCAHTALALQSPQA